MTELPLVERDVVKAISKQSGDRTSAEIKMLVEFFLQTPCFKEIEIKQSDLIKVVQKMEYRRLQANEIIFKIGEVGDYFYILIHG